MFPSHFQSLIYIAFNCFCQLFVYKLCENVICDFLQKVFEQHIFVLGGFKYFSCSLLFGDDSQFDVHIFQRGWFNHQPVILRHSIQNLRCFVVDCYFEALRFSPKLPIDIFPIKCSLPAPFCWLYSGWVVARRMPKQPRFHRVFLLESTGGFGALASGRLGPWPRCPRMLAGSPGHGLLGQPNGFIP